MGQTQSDTIVSALELQVRSLSESLLRDKAATHRRHIDNTARLEQALEEKERELHKARARAARPALQDVTIADLDGIQRESKVKLKIPKSKKKGIVRASRGQRLTRASL